MKDDIPADLRPLRLLNSAQTAKLLNCSMPQLRRWNMKGKIPKPIRIGDRKLAWRASEIIAWIKAHQTA